MSENRVLSENKTLPRIMFAAPKSGSGKTLITCAFLDILKKRGINAVSFKCGPDYIDPIFHSFVTGSRAVSLDTFFLNKDELIQLFTCKTAPLAVIEGVMGYYDGIAGTSFAASSYDIADCLDCPVILIIDMKSSGTSPEKELKELMERVPDSHIRGVILNRAGKEDADELRLKFESLGVSLYGFVPECDEARTESRHLGLKIPSDKEKFSEKISAFSGIIEETTDIDGILKLSREAGELPEAGSEKKNGEPGAYKGTIAVAADEAFCFIYEDNIDFLRELGYEITYFSPLRDKALPSGVSAILFCGGYPEVYAAELSANHEMLDSVRASFGNTKILAECGGFLYLHESLEGIDGKAYPMAGCIRAKAFRTGRSPRFGYISLYRKEKVERITVSGVSDDREACGNRCLIKAHEFHYWDSTAPGSDLTAEKPLSGRSWDCCYLSPVLLAGFPHFYYRSGADLIRSFLGT